MAKVDAMGWIRETRRTYQGNAAAVRDFRVQLRGSRSALLFGVYLFVLIGVAMIVYTNTARGSPV